MNARPARKTYMEDLHSTCTCPTFHLELRASNRDIHMPQLNRGALEPSTLRKTRMQEPHRTCTRHKSEWTPPRSPEAVYVWKIRTVPVPVQSHTWNSERLCAGPGDLHRPGLPLGPNKMSPKLKFHQDWNVTKLKWHQNWNVPVPKMFSNIKRHKKFVKSLELDMTPRPLWKKSKLKQTRCSRGCSIKSLVIKSFTHSFKSVILFLQIFIIS